MNHFSYPKEINTNLLQFFNSLLSLVAFMDIGNVFVPMKNFTISKTLDQMKALNEWEDVWSKSEETKEIKLKIEELKGRFT